MAERCHDTRQKSASQASRESLDNQSASRQESQVGGLRFCLTVGIILQACLRGHFCAEYEGFAL